MKIKYLMLVLFIAIVNMCYAVDTNNAIVNFANSGDICNKYGHYWIDTAHVTHTNRITSYVPRYCPVCNVKQEFCHIWTDVIVTNNIATMPKSELEDIAASGAICDRYEHKWEYSYIKMIESRKCSVCNKVQRETTCWKTIK